MPDQRIAVSSVPVCFAMMPSFLDYHPTHGQNGKIDYFINASFPALGARLEGKEAADHQSAPLCFFRACYLKGIFQPARNGLPGRAFVPIALSSWSADESGGASGRSPERAISIIDHALLAVSRIERNARTGQPTGGTVKLARQVHGFISRAWINGQEFPNL